MIKEIRTNRRTEPEATIPTSPSPNLKSTVSRPLVDSRRVQSTIRELAALTSATHVALLTIAQATAIQPQWKQLAGQYCKPRARTNTEEVSRSQQHHHSANLLMAIRFCRVKDHQ